MMREFRKEQIFFYCNSCGELHRGGKEELRFVDDLPLPLQNIYKDFWTDGLSLPCYIAYVNNRPGLLLAAEYNKEECERQNIPHDFDGKYAVMSERCRRLERLVSTVCNVAELGIGIDTGFDLELMLFIPAQSATAPVVFRLYYLMDKFAFETPPSEIMWNERKYELLELINRCLPPSDMRTKLFAQLMAGEYDQAGELIPYMGLNLHRNCLAKMCDVITSLKQYGANDATLDRYRKVFRNCFGKELILKYPFSDDMREGAVIIPVQEGFLFLPYTEVLLGTGPQYNILSAKILTADSVDGLCKEAGSYFSELSSALDDVTRYLTVSAVDSSKAGIFHFVRSCVGRGFRGRRRLVGFPKNGGDHAHE